MIKKIDNSIKFGNSHISMLYPGSALSKGDTGIGSIGRIDHASIHGGTTIKMHPHANDEILSYFRVGKVFHQDSAGITETISRKKLMLMKAGKVFYHEEKILECLEGLQIFIRPKLADYPLEVIFQDLDSEDSFNEWRLLASNSLNSVLNFTSETEILDITVNRKEYFSLPQTNIENAIFLIYVFQGSIKLSEKSTLIKGESAITDGKDFSFSANPNAEIVLFITNEMQECFKEGMFSGNKLNQ